MALMPTEESHVDGFLSAMDEFLVTRRNLIPDRA
jgi:hypothetical protein